jgi:hypothetical protein
MKTHRAWLGAAGIVTWQLAAILIAQSEKISLSVFPHAGQTVRYRMTQDLTMTITSDADSDMPMPPMNVNAMTAITMSQAAGSADSDGRLPVILTYEEFATEVKINGNAPRLPEKNPFAGKQFTAIYSPDGTVLDLTGPAGTEAMIAPLKQMLTQLSAQLPQVKVAVGETTTIPVKMPLPLPVPGAKGFDLQGTSTLTIVSIDKDGASRVASCESKLNATLVNAADPSSTETAANPGMNPADVAMDLGMVGSGKLQVDIDRGVMKLNESTTTVDGTISTPGRNGKAGRMKLHGVTKITVAEAR